MITRRKFIVLAAAGTLVAGGVATGALLLPEEQPRSGAPKLRFGSEQCGYCGMVISDAHFAAAWREAGGKEQHFDDIGCMVNASRHRDPGADAEWWVSDYQSQSWIEAPRAWYVFSASIRTPMDYGVAAFARGEDATAVARSSGTTVSWSEALQRIERKG